MADNADLDRTSDISNKSPYFTISASRDGRRSNREERIAGANRVDDGRPKRRDVR